MTQSFKCTACNEVYNKWHGKCPNSQCREFNTIEEFTAASGPQKKGGAISSNFQAGNRRSHHVLAPQSLQTTSEPPPRATTHIPEFDRALGGGVVEGSAILIGGDPGIGKSTLLLQAAAYMSRDRRVIYISGEESINQVQMRANRLGLQNSAVELDASQDCLAVADFIETLPPGSLVIVDSMQTMDAGSDSAPGSVSQIKNSAAHLIPAGKNSGVALFLVNHVTKDGTLAGPNVLKHSVDATLYIESDNSSGSYRIMRAEKNRFGETDEIGIFEMRNEGMVSIENPSEVFIAQRDPSAFGTVIFPSIEGTRPLLLEVQALITPTAFGTGRRSATGWDANRMNMVIATMNARLGVNLADMDVYLNVAGGMKIKDPALDFAVVMALLSANSQTALPADLVAFGEVGLAGEIRVASRAEARIKEAKNLGFTNIYAPVDRLGKTKDPHVKEIDRIARLASEIPQIFNASP